MLEKRIVFFCTNMRMLSSIVYVVEYKFALTYTFLQSFFRGFNEAFHLPIRFPSCYPSVITSSLHCSSTLCCRCYKHAKGVRAVWRVTSSRYRSKAIHYTSQREIAFNTGHQSFVSYLLQCLVKKGLIYVRYSKLDSPLRKLSRSFSHNYPHTLPYHPSNEDLQQVFALASIFQTHLSNLFQNFKSHTITDVSDYSNPISVFLKENFVLIEFAESEDDQEFMKMFMDTQMFFDFSDKELQQKDKDATRDLKDLK